MKIGIYGDSFATSHIEHNPNSWYRILATRLNAELTNYAYGGTSVYWTYNNFLENHDKHDLNIVLVTEPNRYTKKSVLPNVQYIPNLSNLEWAKTNLEDITDEQEILARDLEGWYKMCDEDFMLSMSDLMISHMEQLSSNAIFYPCFSNSFTKERFAKNGLINMQLFLLYVHQSRQLGIENEYSAMNEVREHMCAHLGPELNKFFADVMYEGITNNIWSFNGLENVKMNHPLNFYYDMDEK